MQRRDRIALQKITEELQFALYTLKERTLEEFLCDEVLKRALAMTVINVGELVKNVSMDTRRDNPQIPWKEIAGMRDIAAHRYQTLRMEDVYCTVHDDFAELKPMVEEILRREDEAPLKDSTS